ncbi:MAG: WecB/TagA/CpsF family glycosyltransferase [Clostridia bacterium]|nr:WecB/TagA/CpsF family glycosyltransferase [Clostridia bacterium]
MSRICLYGVGIDNVTMGEAVKIALAQVGAPCVVFTPNAVMLDAARREAALCELLGRASLSLPDGMGVVRLAKRRGTPLKERVAGIDFGEALLERAAKEKLRVFLLGGGEGVAAQAARRLQMRYPSLCICGTAWGYFDKNGEENQEVLARIHASRADILLVCMGFPLQEQWITDNLHALSDVRVIAGLGGSLDVWSGRVNRAPAPVSKMGLEWAWRMLREPRRIRYLPAVVRTVFKR